MARTAEQQREYMRRFRAQKRAEQQQSRGLAGAGATGATRASSTDPVDTTGGHQVDTSTSRPTENCRLCDLTYPVGTQHRCTDGWTAAPSSSPKSYSVLDSAQRVAAADHQACDRRIAELEAAVEFHRARYEPLLGVCEAVYAACGRQGDLHQYTLHRDVVDRVREVVEEEVPL